MAAMFVVLEHVPIVQSAASLPAPHWGAFFFRGITAVNLFFTLSGFLITYRLLDEERRNGSISVRSFYFRRVLRIWPLYFFVVAIGLLAYQVVLPRLGLEGPVAYPLSMVLVLYLLFLPNLASSIFHMGGLLDPLWSIGVEEQYYLAWAPLVARRKGAVVGLLAAVLVTFFFLSCAVRELRSELGGWYRFLESLRFHFMAAGGLLGYAALHSRRRLLAWLPLRSKVVRWSMLGMIGQYFLLGWFPRGAVLSEVMELVLFPWVLAEVALQDRPLLRFASRWTEKLGDVSYGVYLYNMPVIHAVAFFFVRTGWMPQSSIPFLVLFYSLAIGGTIGLALVSHRWFESPFLRLKDRFLR